MDPPPLPQGCAGRRRRDGVHLLSRSGRDDLRIVVRYRQPTTYGLHVVLGALDAARPPGRWAVDFARTPEQLGLCVERGRAEAERVLVLWSFFTGHVPAVAEEIAAARRLDDRSTDDGRVVHLAGGVHASAEPERTLRLGFDLVAVGEGEATLVDLVAALGTGSDHRSVEGLAGIDRGVFTTTGSAARHDLDRYPPFAERWTLFNPVEITRGCIYACRFCQTPYLFKARFRHRSIGNIREHLTTMSRRGMRYVRFVSPTALSYGTQTEEPDLDAIEELLATCRSVMGPEAKIYFGSFPSEVRPEHVTSEALTVLRRYVDNPTLVIGAQSGSESVLASSKRGHGVEVIEAAVRNALQFGFEPSVDFLFGLPGETDEDAGASVTLAARLADLGARIHAHTFLPLPGTPYRNAGPGVISPTVKAGLDPLVGRGHVHGQWLEQEQLAKRLVPFVRRRST